MSSLVLTRLRSMAAVVLLVASGVAGGARSGSAFGLVRVTRGGFRPRRRVHAPRIVLEPILFEAWVPSFLLGTAVPPLRCPAPRPRHRYRQQRPSTTAQCPASMKIEFAVVQDPIPLDWRNP